MLLNCVVMALWNIFRASIHFTAPKLFGSCTFSWTCNPICSLAWLCVVFCCCVNLPWICLRLEGFAADADFSQKRYMDRWIGRNVGGGCEAGYPRGSCFQRRGWMRKHLVVRGIGAETTTNERITIFCRFHWWASGTRGVWECKCSNLFAPTSSAIHDRLRLEGYCPAPYI